LSKYQLDNTHFNSAVLAGTLREMFTQLGANTVLRESMLRSRNIIHAFVLPHDALILILSEMPETTDLSNRSKEQSISIDTAWQSLRNMHRAMHSSLDAAALTCSTVV
jgi:hypothetical protein